MIFLHRNFRIFLKIIACFQQREQNTSINREPKKNQDKRSKAPKTIKASKIHHRCHFWKNDEVVNDKKQKQNALSHQ